MKNFLCAVVFLLVVLAAVDSLSAEEVVLVYTGDTHSMLYPCHCPLESDGGIARRASLLKDLRKKHSNLILLDSGSFFSAGLLDQNTQNTQLDMQRCLVNLRAMEMMKYDVLNLSDDEFNFGEEFLSENAAKFKLRLISSNVKSGKIAPYHIVNISGINFAVIGLANSKTRAKLKDFSFVDPKDALAGVIPTVKEKGADIIILLSSLSEADNLKLVNEVSGIDIVIGRYEKANANNSQGKQKAIMLKPSWQGRRLGKTILSIENKKILNYKTEEVRVSDKLADDPAVKAILPRCFSDADCEKSGLVGSCQDAGSLNSSCLFSEPSKARVTIITHKDCVTCNPNQVIEQLKGQFPQIETNTIYYPQKKALTLVKELGITGLPVYLFDKDVEREKVFSKIKGDFLEKGNFYMLKPEVSGVTYMLDRKKEAGRLDIFLSLFDDHAASTLDVIREFNFIIHFLAVLQEDKIDAPKGAVEVEEDLRALCVKKYYPQMFMDYISCRAKNIQSSWWEDCLLDKDSQAIKKCARSEEGKSLLKENIELNRELRIMFGPTYLLENQEIFSSRGSPSKEDLKKIIKR